MKKLYLAVAMLLFGSFAYGQQCDLLVNDQAGVIKNIPATAAAAAGLLNQGADVKIITIPKLSEYGPRLADVERYFETRCPNWTTERGSRKANLFTIIVAPNDKKKNVFFGGAYAGALPSEDEVNTIFSQAANPYFRNGQFGEGIAAALIDFTNKVLAYHDQAKHPTVVTQAATDLKPIAGSFNFLFVLLGLGALVGLFLYLRNRTKRNNEEAKAAQQEAIQAQQEASRLFLAANTESANYERVATKYTNLSNSLSCDPNQEHATAAIYLTIKSYWTGMAYDIKMMDRTDFAAGTSSDPQAYKKAAASSPYSGQTTPPIQTTTVPTPPQTTVINNGNNGFIDGMIVNELLHEHHHSRSDDEDTSSSSGWSSGRSSDDSGSSSGSDSSWSSSNSSSSGSDSSWSSSDSGSSSSFDSGSSGGDSSW